MLKSFNAILRRARAGAVRRQLLNQDDRILQDLGLTRHQVERMTADQLLG